MKEQQNKAPERRFMQFEVRSGTDEKRGKILSGRPIVYNSKTDIGPFDEVIEPNALDGCDLTDVRFLVNHNTEMIPLARSRRNNGSSTMKMTPDDKGLSIDYIQLDTERNATASALYSAVERGDMDGMSFMFAVASDKWDNLDSDHPTRHILKFAKVYEVSAVTLPAYEATEIGVRNAKALESARAALESARSNAPQNTIDLALEKARTQTLLLL